MWDVGEEGGCQKGACGHCTEELSKRVNGLEKVGCTASLGKAKLIDITLRK